MLQELSSFLPVVVATALLGYSAMAWRKAMRRNTPVARWNDYVR